MYLEVPRSTILKRQREVHSDSFALLSAQCDQIWAIHSTLGNFLKLAATIISPKLHHILRHFLKGVIFLVKSFLGNYRHLATLYWTHC